MQLRQTWVVYCLHNYVYTTKNYSPCMRQPCSNLWKQTRTYCGWRADVMSHALGICSNERTADVKWRHGRHLERGCQKLDSVNLCVCTWRTILPNVKFHSDSIWNDGALGFFEERNCNKKMSSWSKKQSTAAGVRSVVMVRWRNAWQSARKTDWEHSSCSRRHQQNNRRPAGQTDRPVQ